MSSIVAVDASVLVWMLEEQPHEDIERLREWTNVRATMRQLRDRGGVFVVPAPAIAELHSGPHGSEIAALLGQRGARMRVEALDHQAAQIAGEMIAKCRPKAASLASGTTPRNVIKYDALIAAVAHRIGASVLVTADDRGFKRYLEAVGSSVRVEIATDARGQLRILGT